ncbi:hypothetical protein J422_06962 [Methanocaldococcus villosus KIN24-T80]|uniref:Oligosaccharide repeat unit polymerase n=1 Tax=Methanocaldococcus villosus KIN24-T80 TaxID=1069083 RepID=N6VWY2_9EURY|nr:oligosaccharide repeat unit polymerase family protein [Methanocaldococcus villosus]ENN95607.1 hypothetical protein J422_06962 [Methanocaldococcus villosus KIN24-T80]
MIELHHLFIFLIAIYIIFSDVSVNAAIIFLISGIVFYISFIVGKDLFKLDVGKFVGSNYIDRGFGYLLLIIGFVSVVIDLILSGSIPLFDPLSRRFLNVYLTTLSHLFIVGYAIILATENIDKKRAIIYTIIFSIFISLLGYRTNVLALLLSSFAVLYYKGELKKRELLIFGIIIFSILLTLSILRLMFLGALGNPILSRISLTMSIYDIIYNHYNDMFYGFLHYAAIMSYFGHSVGPRYFIAKTLNIEGVTITPTVVGAIIADYGVLAIIPYFGFLGIFLGFLYKLAKRLRGIYLGIFGVLFAYTLISVESGILDLDVIIYYIFGILLCLRTILKSLRNSCYKKYLVILWNSLTEKKK